MSAESGLFVLVPEAEVLVKPFRDRHDPSAGVGVPAHITLLYPFKPPNEINGPVVEKLRDGLGGFAPIQFSLSPLRRGVRSGILYLAPEPDEPFRRLTMAIWNWYPDNPPYGGVWLPDIVPHLTVAQPSDEEERERIAQDFTKASEGKFPIRAKASEVTLMDNRSGRWQVSRTISLGHASD